MVTRAAHFYSRVVYIADIYRPETIFLPLILWIYLRSLLHSELRRKLGLYSVR